MNKLAQLVTQHQAKTRPVNAENIQTLEQKLGFQLSVDYKNFLSSFGIIVFDSNETYGLGVPEDYYLNVFNIYSDLHQDKSFPAFAVPLLEIGDGQYYLYDNESHKILVWATPNGGIVRVIDEALETFLIKQLFKDEKISH